VASAVEILAELVGPPGQGLGHGRRAAVPGRERIEPALEEEGADLGRRPRAGEGDLAEAVLGRGEHQRPTGLSTVSVQAGTARFPGHGGARPPAAGQSIGDAHTASSTEPSRSKPSSWRAQ
jgi:hypothetical protein